MIRRAHQGDAAAIDAFLARSPETCMFLRSNLAAHGLEERQAPRGMEVHIYETNGRISGVFARSNTGYVQAQGPVEDDDFWDALGREMAGQSVFGFSGTPEITARIRAALGLEEAHFSLLEREGLYRLDLDRLTPPRVTIRPPEAADLPLLTDWIYDYDTSTLGAPQGAATRARVAKVAERAVADGQTRLLIEHGRPTAKTAFNARLPDMVQVGGVYVPPALRNEGRARRVVAAHLAQACAEGVQTAILVTANPVAARAYRAIGFTRIGEYALALLPAPVTIGAAP